MSNLSKISTPHVSCRSILRLLLPSNSIFLALVNYKPISRASMVCLTVQLAQGQKYGRAKKASGPAALSGLAPASPAVNRTSLNKGPSLADLKKIINNNP